MFPDNIFSDKPFCFLIFPAVLRFFLMFPDTVFQVKWDRVPQPIAIDIKLMRAVRDRLPNGRYVFLVTLYDRIGGSPLFWTEAGLNGSSVGLPGKRMIVQ